MGSVQSERDGRVCQMWAEMQERGPGLAGYMQKGQAHIWGYLHKQLGVRGIYKDIEKVKLHEESMGRPGLARYM